MTVGRDASDDAAAPQTLLADAFARHRREAIATALRVLRTPQLAEDALQLAFLQMLVRMQSGDGDLLAGDAAATVRRAARWAALKIRARDQQRHAVVPLDDDAGESSRLWQQSETHALCTQLLDALPAHYQEVLRLRYADDLADAVASRRLRITLKAYRRRLDRALAVARSAAARLDIDMRRALLLPFVREAHRRVRSGHPGRLLAAVAMIGLVGSGAGTTAPRHDGESAPHGSSARSSDGLRRLAGAGQPAGRTIIDSARASLAHVPAPQVAPEPSPAARPSGSAQLATPERTHISAITPAPDYQRTHTVVVTGEGIDCGCAVALLSRDGGATWTAARLPPQGFSVVLPPRFPDDPSMIVDTGTAGWVPPCLWPSLGAAVCVPLPFTEPEVFDAEYDSGFPVIYGQNLLGYGVLAYNVKTHDAHLMMPSISGSPLDLAAPAVDSAVSLYVAGFGPIDSTAVALEPHQDYELVACHRDFTCRLQSVHALWPIPWVPMLDDEDPAGSLIGGFSGTTFGPLLSRDGGRTFAALTAPAPGGIASLQFVGQPTAPVAVAMVWRNGVATLWRQEVGSAAAWKMIASMPHLGDELFTAVTAQRILFSRGLGLECTADGGTTWAPRCPPA